MIGYHIIRSDQGDWIALYRHGRLLEQGHSISEESMLRLLGAQFTSEERDLSDTGHAPLDLNEDTFPGPLR